MSADGSKVTVADNYRERLYVSTDFGNTWVQAKITYASHVAVSADGGTLVAAGTSLLATSTDLGMAWVSSGLSNFGWSAVAASADGTRLVAATFGSYDQFGNNTPGTIFTSADRGVTWTLTSAPSDYWFDVASSADGTRLVAAALGGPLYTTTNSGVTWISNNLPASGWRSVASSADGCKLVAVETGESLAHVGGIYTWQTTPTPVLSVASSSDGSLISWVVPSMPFVLQENADLTTTNWIDVTAMPILNYTNLHHEVSVSISSVSRFYRLKRL